ncbi:Colicin V production protein [hydrothermal vent metagenome]|uniref:Colicin V production protein n=1 Tax=hydrothermal vent metagenome TaxID=652676 RepID=A0A1W1C849_9ZZZZ
MDISTLNYFDAIIGGIILILAFKGFLNGAIKEFFGLVGIIGGVYISSRVVDDVSIFLYDNFFKIDNEATLKLLSFISVLALIWISSIILGAMFSKLSEMSGLGFMNRMFGFIMGGGKYFLIFSLIVTALSNVAVVQENLGKYVKDSKLYPYLKESGAVLINLDFKKA